MRLGLGRRLCCCGGETPCQLTCPGPPTVPAEYQIEVSGIGNGQNCDDCDQLNGTFILSFNEQSLNANTCSWFSPDMTVCERNPVRWEYQIVCSGCPDGSDEVGPLCRNVLSVRAINGTTIFDPAIPYALPFAGYGEVTLPLWSPNTSLCDGWPASITVTPL